MTKIYVFSTSVLCVWKHPQTKASDKATKGWRSHWGKICTARNRKTFISETTITCFTSSWEQTFNKLSQKYSSSHLSSLIKRYSNVFFWRLSVSHHFLNILNDLENATHIMNVGHYYKNVKFSAVLETLLSRSLSFLQLESKACRKIRGPVCSHLFGCRNLYPIVYDPIVLKKTSQHRTFIICVKYHSSLICTTRITRRETRAALCGRHVSLFLNRDY